MPESRLPSLSFAALAVSGITLGIVSWPWSSEVPARVSGIGFEAGAGERPPGFVAREPEPPIEPSAAAPETLAPTPNHTSILGRELLDAKDLRAFVVHALAQPEKGGAFYAGLALGQCGEGVESLREASEATILRVIARESTISVERMEGIRRQVSRCASFAAGELRAFTEQVVKHGEDGTDPLVALTMFSSTRDSAAEAANVDAVLKSGSAALMSSQAIPVRFIVNLDPRALRLVYRYDGQGVTDTTSQLALVAGAMLSVCSENDYCVLDESAMSACLWRGACYASRDDYVRLDPEQLNGDAAAYEQAVKFRDEIRAALARGDRSIFR